jgi:hypothetical protein
VHNDDHASDWPDLRDGTLGDIASDSDLIESNRLEVFKQWTCHMRPHQVMKLVLDGAALNIPSAIDREVDALIRSCCAYDAGDRPSFHHIFGVLKRMNFTMMPGVNGKTVSKFVSLIEKWEEKRADNPWADEDQVSGEH